jgi:STE24 endopeptidase
VTLSPWRRVRADPVDWFDAAEIERGRAYVHPIRRMGHVQNAFSAAVAVAFVAGDGGPRVVDALDVRGWVLQLAVVLGTFFLLELLVSVWFDAWREMHWDKRWEMSTQTWRGFVTDQLKSTVVYGLVVFVLLAPLWALIRATDLWWLFGWLLLAGFALLAATLGPVLIAPVFNRYTPMEDEALRERLLDVARTAELDVSEVLVADASRRSRAINAHVSGLGKTRRVVVFDTLLDWPAEQLEQIVGHELGHWRFRHVLRRVPVLVVAQGLSLALAAAVLRWDWLLDGAGVDSIEDPAALPLFLLVFQLGFMATTFVTSWLSRADERAADLYALDLLHDPDAFSAAFRHLTEANKAEVDPPLWKRITHTHPPLAERLAMAAVWRAAQVVEETGRAPGLRPRARRTAPA